MRYGLLDYSSQVKEVTKAWVKEKSPEGRKGLDTLLRNLRNRGGEMVSLNEHLWRSRGAFNDLKSLYETEVRNVEKEQTYTHIITQPVPADKKSYPIRWLIVLVSIISVFLFSLIVIVVLENIKKATVKTS